MPKEYMEAEKKLCQISSWILMIKLHLQKYFSGSSQVELNEVVSRLNSYKTLDQAKDYLSDVYYERNWQKVDEYTPKIVGFGRE